MILSQEIDGIKSAWNAKLKRLLLKLATVQLGILITYVRQRSSQNVMSILPSQLCTKGAKINMRILNTTFIPFKDLTLATFTISAESTLFNTN